MFGLGHWEIILILVIVLIVFGAGKLPKVAGEIAKGIKSFKEGLKEEKKSNNKKNPIDSEMLNRADNKRRDAYGPSYLSFEKDLYINERLRGIADTVMISNKILKKQPFPDLEVLTDFEKKYLESDTEAQTYQRTTAKHLRTLQNRDINLSRIVRQNRHYRAWGLDNFRKYQEKIFAFGVLYLNIINNEIDYKEIIKSDFSEIFGFKYNLFLDDYQSLEGFNPQKWFPLLSQNKTFPLLREKG